jgi:hypothetical protein
MSRVDEARRRALGREIEVPRSDGGGAAGTRVDAAELENYPLERRGVERNTPIQPARTIAAPRTASSGHLGSLDSALDGKLVGGPDTPAIVVEQYRRLAGSLHQLHTDGGLKTLMVTSAMPRVG